MEIEYWQNVALMTLLSLKVATLACALIFVPGVAAGYFFSRARFPGRSFLEAVLLLPLVVPPVAVGLVLLYLLSTDGFIGGPLYNWFNANILLTWWAAACASAVVAFPLLFKGVQQAFREVPEDYIALATTLGKTRWQIFWQVSLPLAKAGIFQAMLLAFARALGEFGATTLVAGNIPKKRKPLPLESTTAFLPAMIMTPGFFLGFPHFLVLPPCFLPAPWSVASSSPARVSYELDGKSAS